MGENKYLYGEGLSIPRGKVAVKESVIGHMVSIEEGCSIERCLLMSNIVIEENVKLKNCVVCSNSKIRSGCDLDDCYIAPGAVIETNSEEKGEDLPFKPGRKREDILLSSDFETDFY